MYLKVIESLTDVSNPKVVIDESTKYFFDITYAKYGWCTDKDGASYVNLNIQNKDKSFIEISLGVGEGGEIRAYLCSTYTGKTIEKLH